MSEGFQIAEDNTQSHILIKKVTTGKTDSTTWADIPGLQVSIYDVPERAVTISLDITGVRGPDVNSNDISIGIAIDDVIVRSARIGRYASQETMPVHLEYDVSRAFKGSTVEAKWLTSVGTASLVGTVEGGYAVLKVHVHSPNTTFATRD